MNCQLDLISICHIAVAQYVVYVAMRIDQLYRSEAFAANEVAQLLLFCCSMTTGVNDNALMRLVVQDVGIFLKRIESKGANLEHLR